MRRVFTVLSLAALAVAHSNAIPTHAADAPAAEASEAPAEPELLTIGSSAPALDIEHWFGADAEGFEPITSFESGHVYVVEFWATWCPPCRTSMPHLAQLQTEYADKQVHIVSVSDEDVETIEPFLEKEAPSLGEGAETVTFGQLTAQYSLTTDPDGSVKEDYMRAAQQRGIPTSFIVGKDAHIEWIGHPMQMDGPLKKVVEGTWDRDAYLKAKKGYDEMMQKLNTAVQAGDMDGAMQAVDGFIAETTSEDYKEQAQQIRPRVQGAVYQGWVRSDQAKAADWIAKQAEDKEVATEEVNGLAWAVVQAAERGGIKIDERLSQAAIEAIRSRMDADSPAANNLDTIAHLLHLGGDLDGAIEVQEQAASSAEGPTRGPIKAFLAKLKKEKADAEAEEAAEEAGDDADE